jgi:hypothetical protein
VQVHRETVLLLARVGGELLKEQVAGGDQSVERAAPAASVGMGAPDDPTKGGTHGGPVGGLGELKGSKGSTDLFARSIHLLTFSPRAISSRGLERAAAAEA